MNFCDVTGLILQCLKTSVLPWLLYPSFLTENAKKLANKIINWQAESKIFQNTHLLYSDNTFLKLKNSTDDLTISASLCVLSESWTNTQKITKWLDDLEKTPDTFQKTIFTFLLAVFMDNFESPDISIKCLRILVENVRTAKTLTNNLLILLLYKLPETQKSYLHLEILKALPKLATREENVVLVKLTVESLGESSRTLYTFAMSLMFEMWKNENRFYGHLEKFLAQTQEMPDWEYYVTKSFILKEICSMR